MSSKVLHIDSQKAWDILSREEESCLVDVRTEAEWMFVGVPNLKKINKKLVLISWLEFPQMNLNPTFIEDLTSLIKNKFAKLFFICRSGGRSAHAAEYAEKHGFKNCYNILDGFEGGIDEKSKHRNEVSGWRFNNLPWEQS